jgi:NADH dehydrogenase FAD-containing subunit
MTRNADILIVGGGFAGLSCFRSVDRRRRSVTLLSDRNHFLFTPLLPLAATGAVEVRSIVEPLWSFQKSPGEIVIGRVADIDSVKREVLIESDPQDPLKIRYRVLVLAIGAVTSTYGIPGVEQHCLYFKQMKHARVLRERILAQFERAMDLTGAARKRALCFAVVGGGATGVELACEIHDLIEEDLKREFPDLAKESDVQVIEGRNAILTEFGQTLAHYAARKLKQKRIHVQTGIPAREVRDHQVVLDNGQIVEAETIIWTAGIGPSPFLKQLAGRWGVELERGRIPVNGRFAVGGKYPEVYAIGDCASFKDPGGHALPPTAQVAMKEGIFLGKQLSHGGHADFSFRSMGMLASLGSGSAIADLGFLQFKGRLAWWFWKAAYLTRLVSLRNKATVAFDWLKIRLFGRNTARIDY